MPTPGTLANGLPAGIGNPAEATQATAWVRQQPWYQDFLKQYGVTEGANQQVKLNDTQRAALMATMIKNGIGLNSKYDSVDENGMIAEEHHKLKKAAIAAAIGGLALTGFGAAGIGPLAGALGGAGAAGAGGAASAAALEGSATAGIAGAGALGLPITAGLGTLGGVGTAAAVGGTAGLAGIGEFGAAAPAIGSAAAPALAAPVSAVASQAAPAATGGLVAPVAGGASKGLSSWLTGPTAGLISQGIGVAGNIYAANKQADTAADAAKIQADEYDKALAAAKEEQDYNRNQYGSYLSRLDPYTQTGAASNDRLAQFMGQPPPGRPASMAQAAPIVKPPATQTTVTLQAPDGSTKDVPSDQAPHFISLGAKVIGGQGAVT